MKETHFSSLPILLIFSVGGIPSLHGAEHSLFLSVTHDSKAKLESFQAERRLKQNSPDSVDSFILTQRCIEQGIPVPHAFRYTIEHPQIINNAIAHEDSEHLTLLLKLAENRNALLEKIIGNNNTHLLETLLDTGILERGDVTSSIAFRALHSNNLSLLSKLLDMGISQNSLNGSQESLLSCAVRQKKNNFVCFLLKKGADANLPSGNQSPLMLAIKAEDSAILKELLQAGANVQAGCDYSPLEAAIRTGNISVVQVLVEAGAPVQQESSLLLQALRVGYADIAAYLLTHGAEDELYKEESAVAEYVLNLNGYPDHMTSVISTIKEKVQSYRKMEQKRIEEEQKCEQERRAQEQHAKTEALKQEQLRIDLAEKQKAANRPAHQKQIFSTFKYISSARPKSGARFYVFIHMRPSYSSRENYTSYLFHRVTDNEFYTELKNAGFEILAVYYEQDMASIRRYALAPSSIPGILADSVQLPTLPKPTKEGGKYSDADNFWETVSVLDCDFNLLPHCRNMKWGEFEGHYDCFKYNQPYYSPFKRK